ncbi:hypothetical protein ACJMK2_013067 [Sinanodonta woodiana]|uniref:Uncharacterized protein n=1 Tax=Sinanodonta woodiana TaxID=1069815 RepID=A0ABD3VD53_SINWO
METRDAKFWKTLEKKAKIWMENSINEASFGMFYLPKPNKSKPVPQIKFFRFEVIGLLKTTSYTLSSGSSNMKKFIEDVEVRKKFVDSLFHPREPDPYTMDDLRILANSLVREDGCSLSHPDLEKIIDAYRGYRQLITTNDHKQQLKLLTPQKRRHNCTVIASVAIQCTIVRRMHDICLPDSNEARHGFDMNEKRNRDYSMLNNYCINY